MFFWLSVLPCNTTRRIIHVTVKTNLPLTAVVLVMRRLSRRAAVLFRKPRYKLVVLKAKNINPEPHMHGVVSSWHLSTKYTYESQNSEPV